MHCTLHDTSEKTLIVVSRPFSLNPRKFEHADESRHLTVYIQDMMQHITLSGNNVTFKLNKKSKQMN